MVYSLYHFDFNPTLESKEWAHVANKITFIKHKLYTLTLKISSKSLHKTSFFAVFSWFLKTLFGPLY